MLHATATEFDGILDVQRTYKEDGSEETTTTSTHEIRYRIHNKMHLSSHQAAPVLVLHGGPSVPAHYLEPLQTVVPYRSIIFYDQLGCGRSPGPDCADAYSIQNSLDDLEALIRKIGLRRFHLYGQSFGGILAFEYIKRLAERAESDDDPPKCLSAVFSSSPCDVQAVESVANELIAKLLEEDPNESTIMERFRLKHQCMTPEKPQPLVDAYEVAGAPGIWRGTDAIKDWKATKPREGAKRMPSAMVLRGEHDFVTSSCVEGWKEVFNHAYVRMKVLEGCSHHGLLENGKEYGQIVDSYFSEYD
eukprot:CAMPEP_0197233254 /NCGR_PEP_ID=MMETSP1429-20130617/1367_1 /TAXON_ID=49237 /ORGANISM="Chaetoceros  sp., Strain UNC1202" /LENGTH=303 /DNA_ID=CAMNT_0042691469 /DNA_START=351 /DNA_END=1262 /DNA_ORIENTATION=+